ncbi:hypothetical protein RvY_15321, partial [Ramazzottius varieornatus]
LSATVALNISELIQPAWSPQHSLGLSSNVATGKKYFVWFMLTGEQHRKVSDYLPTEKFLLRSQYHDGGLHKGSGQLLCSRTHGEKKRGCWSGALLCVCSRARTLLFFPKIRKLIAGATRSLRVPAPTYPRRSERLLPYVRQHQQQSDRSTCSVRKPLSEAFGPEKKNMFHDVSIAIASLHLRKQQTRRAQDRLKSGKLCRATSGAHRSRHDVCGTDLKLCNERLWRDLTRKTKG